MIPPDASGAAAAELRRTLILVVSIGLITIGEGLSLYVLGRLAGWW